MANIQWKAPLQDTGTLEGPTVAGIDLDQDNIIVPEDKELHDAMEAEEDDIGDLFATPPLRPAPAFPQSPPKEPTTGFKWIDECRKAIEDRRESFFTPFPHVSKAIQQSLDDAERTLGGTRAILSKLRKIAHRVNSQKSLSVFEAGDATQETGEDGSQDTLECVWRIMVVEARIWPSIAAKAQDVPKSGPESEDDEPAPVVKSKEERGMQEGNEDAGNVLLQCCDGMAN